MWVWVVGGIRSTSENKSKRHSKQHVFLLNHARLARKCLSMSPFDPFHRVDKVQPRIVMRRVLNISSLKRGFYLLLVKNTKLMMNLFWIGYLAWREAAITIYILLLIIVSFDNLVGSVARVQLELNWKWYQSNGTSNASQHGWRLLMHRKRLYYSSLVT